MKSKDYFLTQESFSIIDSTIPGVKKTEPVPKDLDRYYDSPDYFSHHDSKKIISKIYSFIQRINLSSKYGIIRKLVEGPGLIYDYGCGKGDFLLYMQGKKWKTFGYEPNTSTANLLGKRNIKNYEIRHHELPKTFEIITLWHVLEHLHDPYATVEELLKHLKPNGYLIIAVPNHLSFDCEYYKEYWAGYDLPRHLWHFSEEGLINLFQTLPVILKGTKGQLFDAYYVSLLSEGYKGRKLRFLYAGILGTLSNLKSLYTKQYSSKIYIFQKTLED